METKSGLSYNVLMGIVLKSMRNKHGIKQSELMEAADVGRATWSRIENGQAAIDAAQLSNVVTQCFKMSMSQFFLQVEKIDSEIAEILREKAQEEHVEESTVLENILGTVGLISLGAVIAYFVKVINDD